MDLQLLDNHTFLLAASPAASRGGHSADFSPSLHSCGCPAVPDLPDAFISSFLSSLEQPGKTSSNSASCICMSALVSTQTHQPQRNTGLRCPLQTSASLRSCLTFSPQCLFPCLLLANFINTEISKNFFLLLSYPWKATKTKIKEAKPSANQWSLFSCYAFACSWGCC